MDAIFDIETYPNCFLVTFIEVNSDTPITFEMSDHVNQAKQICLYVDTLKRKQGRLVGFNNVGFDYPVLHLVLKGVSDVKTLFNKASEIINSRDSEGGRWTHIVYPQDRVIQQIDLFLIHHFDNFAKATSLKILEFNMRAESVKELPFKPGSALTLDQIRELKKYNVYDVMQTKAFYEISKKEIAFREKLTRVLGKDFLNHNDTKIGKDYFITKLKAANVPCYVYGAEGRTPNQTTRKTIALKDAVLPSIRFENKNLSKVLHYFRSSVIEETKGVFKDLKATINGFDFYFGTGGLHGSVSNCVVKPKKNELLVDLDVQSYYPNLAIVNKFYPEHLTERFCTIYKTLFEQRKKYPKNTHPVENEMLKLALNGVFGDSNSKFSVFYDPLFTMKITVNGQLLLCVLVEELLKVGAKIIQVNTDGVTVLIKSEQDEMLKKVCAEWENSTKLVLERNNYSAMYIRDVNNYIAVKTNGDVKRKGAYEYNIHHWQDHSLLVVPKVAEKVLLLGGNIRNYLLNHNDLYDFFGRTKTPKKSSLWAGSKRVQNVSRFFISTNGEPLTKVMPTTAKQNEKALADWGKKNASVATLMTVLFGEKEISLFSGYTATIANDTIAINKQSIDYSFYENEVEKLVMGFTEYE